MIVLKPNPKNKGAHDVRHQIEKLLAGDPLPEDPPKDLKTLNWKPNPMVLVPAALEGVLSDFEEALPGFTKFFGPVSKMDVG
jgi:hypothetical protein